MSSPLKQRVKGESPKDFLFLHLRDLPYFRAMLRAVEAEFYQALDLPAPILDIGCGDGHFASVVFDQPIDVGLDPWGGPIHEAAGRGGYRALVQGDGGEMPFPGGHFASAISNSVLEHIPHIERVLVETGRVLKPGAPFVFCVPNPRYFSALSVPAAFSRVGLTGLAQAYTRWFRKMSRVEHAVDPSAWQAWLEQSGFRLERWWHYFSPPAMRALEWGHYFGAPTLLPHALTRRWILAPYRWNLAVTEAYCRRYALPVEDEQGTFTFYIARRL